jgi:hypothetical protein
VDALGLAAGEAQNFIWIALVVVVFALGFIAGQQR